jgi:predicted  nucleic acid-binding Zn-ribbon protein
VSKNTGNVKNPVDRLVRIREGIMQTLKELREKIQALEAERARLLGEIEGLRKAAESRAVALESEVKQIREEAQSLRTVLDTSAKPETTAPVNAQTIQIKPS